MTLSDDRAEFLLDCFHGAFYRSIDYWAFCTNYKDGRDGEPASAIIRDSEGDNENYVIDLDVIERGIERICDRPMVNDDMTKNIMLANRENDAGMLDAFDYDAIVQAGLFDEVRYG